MISISCRRLAELLGGEVSGADAVLCPGPGHSAGDRSLSVKLDKDAPNGFVVHSFAGDDPIVCRDYVREKLGLPPFEPKKRGRGRKQKKRKKSGGGPWTIISEHVYRDADDVPYLMVRKRRNEQGEKDYSQFHWDGTQWVDGKGGGEDPLQLAAAAGRATHDNRLFR